MNKKNAPQLADKTHTVQPIRIGAMQRLFNAWRRWVDLFDHTPFDYTVDRIGQLEGRVLELERAQNATVKMPSKTL